jgi:hypothetical protein
MRGAGSSKTGDSEFGIVASTNPFSRWRESADKSDALERFAPAD